MGPIVRPAHAQLVLSAVSSLLMMYLIEDPCP
jgi:hypothetical protein